MLLFVIIIRASSSSSSSCSDAVVGGEPGVEKHEEDVVKAAENARAVVLEVLEEAAGVGPVIVRRHGGLKISPGGVLQERVLEIDRYVPQAVFPAGGGGARDRRRIGRTRGRGHQVLEASISSSRLQSNHLDVGSDIAAAAAAAVVVVVVNAVGDQIFGIGIGRI